MSDELSVLGTTLGKLPGGIVLDVATGAGTFATVMENFFKGCVFIAAIDSAGKPLRHIIEQTGSGKIIPAAMDGGLLAFRDGSFNTVAISNSLHHLNDTGLILSEMMRSLAPGGHFIVKEMFRDGDQTPAQQTHTMLHDWWAAVDSQNEVIHNPVFTEAELKAQIESIGLSGLGFQIEEDLSRDPFDPQLISHINKTLDNYEKRIGELEELIDQGNSARRHLDKYGFTSARALIAVGIKSN